MTVERKKSKWNPPSHPITHSQAAQTNNQEEIDIRSDGVEQLPVLHLKGGPYLGGVLDRVADQLALLPEREVDLLLVVLALDVRHVDGDEDVG